MPNTDDEQGPFGWQFVQVVTPTPPRPQPVVLQAINAIRNDARPEVGSTDIPLSMAERLFGIEAVQILSVEPDPRFFGYDYYYNSKTNRLYRKISTSPVPVWKPIGG